MGGQSLAVDLGAAAGAADALGDVEDNASEAILVDVYFLVVRDLSYIASLGRLDVSYIFYMYSIE